MHENFPSDPFTVGIGIVAVVAAVIGYIGFPGNSLLGALIFLLIVAIPLLALEWVGFFVRDFVKGRSN